jgi:hypothetical protein
VSLRFHDAVDPPVERLPDPCGAIWDFDQANAQMSGLVFGFWRHVRWVLVNDEAQRSIGYLLAKTNQIFTENWLSDPVTLGVGDGNISLIGDDTQLFVTTASESFCHQE